MSDFPWIIGLMSGTSMDGIDAALLRTDGRAVAAFGLARTQAYTPELRARIRASLNPVAHGGGDHGLGRALAEAHAQAVAELLDAAGLKPGDIRLLGFHGHTLLHRPHRGRTWQTGDAGLLAKLTGIATVSDFRSQDVAVGGQGAPLVPLYHRALAEKAGLNLPLLVLNIGGVANVTYIGGPEDADLLAFDTGPGNALLDDWLHRHTGEAMDAGGRLSAQGSVDEDVLAAMLAHPYFSRPAPKSLDRDDFTLDPLAELWPASGAATLAAFTAAAVARGVELLPKPPLRCLVCGGGRHNPSIMRELALRLEMPVQPVEAVGWRGDALEAEAFAYLAARAVAGLPLSLPGTTGAAYPVSGGRLWQPLTAGPLTAGPLANGPLANGP
ncbi:anhydro-N-acetylmuramic acid kinase [Ferrovibrio sp.]|uniref:anhydro-N-acetylmuramic acid kinase n=1 Tax=Ferrovibrio sp. TaxID=1917215 RepID=UPI0025BA729D|nr:anhydro-N-acetylmuramic acid kinase [Ferrovibrio sp.]MBX3456687.1 anhydro-N-acetylmuramic acid kinase [Ferrovibrio sp.]